MNLVAEPVEPTHPIESIATAKLAEPSRRAGRLSDEERQRLILKHLPQVRLVARRVHGRLPECVCLEDLISTGTVGLIAAIDRFDPAHNVQLKTYAEHKIKGAILDSLRRLDWAPRQQRKHAKQIEAAIAAGEQRLQRPPTEEETAAELHLTVDRYHQWQVETRGINLRRLQSAGPDPAEDRDLLSCLSSDSSQWPSALLERNELQRTLAAAVAGMPEAEKTVLNLYYRDELTLREIAKIMSLHESRISQLKSQAIRRLRVSMAKIWPDTGTPLRDKPGSGTPSQALGRSPAGPAARAQKRADMLRCSARAGR